MAPLDAIVAERAADWKDKFGPKGLGLTVEVLTGACVWGWGLGAGEDAFSGSACAASGACSRSAARHPKPCPHRRTAALTGPNRPKPALAHPPPPRRERV